MEEGNTPAPGLAPLPNAPSKPKLLARFKSFIVRNKKLLMIVVPIVIIIGGSAFIWFYINRKPVTTTVTIKALKPKTTTPTTVADPLTGLMVAPSVASQPVTGIMIENLYPDARPQSGLAQAGIVYEALAEGGITRFMGIFQEPFPATIGPVRSLRPYYLDWGLEYNIPVVHAGGSQPALAEIGPTGLKNVDALVQSSGFYRSTDRAAPHNLYSTNDLLSALLTKLKFDTSPTFTGLPRKADTPPPTGTAPSHTDINITFGAAAYNSEYKYDASTNSYDRFNGGTAQIDRNTNQQILVKNVVVEFTPVSYGTQGDGKPETDYNLIGSGTAYVFEDGGMITGTWNKTSAASPTQLLDANGKAIEFNRGNTWFSVVPTGNAVTF